MDKAERFRHAEGKNVPENEGKPTQQQALDYAKEVNKKTTKTIRDGKQRN